MAMDTALSGLHDPQTGLAGDDVGRMTRDPRFMELVKKRNGLAVTLTVVTMAVYLAFILLVAFDKPLLATKVGGGTTSVGIVFGLVVIVLSFVVTAIYVSAANGRFDELTSQIKREFDR